MCSSQQPTHGADSADERTAVPGGLPCDFCGNLEGTFAVFLSAAGVVRRCEACTAKVEEAYRRELHGASAP